MHARDIMTSPAITVPPESSVLDAVKLMLEKRISALPVVAADGALVGLVSEGDLIRRSETGARDYSSWWLAAIGGTARLAEEFLKTHGMIVDQIMTRTVVTVHEDLPVWKIAETLERKKIKRVPVMHGETVVGIVSRANLLQALAAQREKLMENPSTDDRALRRSVLEKLSGQSWADLSHVNVVVLEGVVHYWGLVNSQAERQALKAAAQGVPGVRDVSDHTHVVLTLV